MFNDLHICNCFACGSWFALVFETVLIAIQNLSDSYIGILF